MKTGAHMKLTQEFVKAVQEELKRLGVTIELESGEGTFNIQGVGSNTIIVTVTIESHAVVSSGE